MFLSKSEDDIQNIAKTQRNILKNAVRYLKIGGKLVYSTCTLFDEENKSVVDSVLEQDKYELEKIRFCLPQLNEQFDANAGSITILPHGQYDGFYIAKIARCNND